MYSSVISILYFIDIEILLSSKLIYISLRILFIKCISCHIWHYHGKKYLHYKMPSLNSYLHNKVDDKQFKSQWEGKKGILFAVLMDEHKNNMLFFINDDVILHVNLFKNMVQIPFWLSYLENHSHAYSVPIKTCFKLISLKWIQNAFITRSL